MGTLEGFVMGQALAPDYDTGPAWRARAGREEARAERAEDRVEKLSAALEKEHKRFLIERQERKSYMRGWAVRGKVLMDNCGYSVERMEAEADILEDKYKNRLSEICQEKDAEIDQQAGF